MKVLKIAFRTENEMKLLIADGDEDMTAMPTQFYCHFQQRPEKGYQRGRGYREQSGVFMTRLPLMLLQHLQPHRP